MIARTWKELFQAEKDKAYFKLIFSTLEQERGQDNIYPAEEDIFRAFKETPLEQVRIVVLGQDPYHTPGIADGLAFSSRTGVIPPSLRNIFTEILRSCYPEKKQVDGIPQPLEELFSTDLTAWAQQGVLLLNTALTVRQGEPGSHSALWKPFIQEVLETLYGQDRPILWLLWGKHACDICHTATGGFWGRVDCNPVHRVVQSAHPSPLSADKGFHGNGHFAYANAHLYMCGYEPINWMNK